MSTGEIGSYTFRLEGQSDSQVLLGEKDAYEARGRRAFFEGMKNRQVYTVKNSTKSQKRPTQKKPKK